MQVPFFDSRTQHKLLKEELSKAFESVLKRGELIYGQYVSSFENEFANYLNTNNCIGVANGADALYISLKALEIGKGDEVITSAHSWISTADAITRTGAEPVFVDTNIFHLIDETHIESKITKKTKAILPVHLYGQMADVQAITSVCENYNLWMVEDCAQAHGATFQGKKAGTFGHVNAFSFYPTKNLGALGDAGAITTNSAELTTACRIIANNGLNSQKKPTIASINSRMDALQAAFLSIKLQKLDDWNLRRQQIAQLYHDELATISQIQVPQIKKGYTHVFHVFAIETDDREQLVKYLESKNIGTALHYDYLIPFTKNYAYQKNVKADFPNAVKTSKRLLSLPIYPELTNEQVYYVCESIRSFFTNQ